MITPSEIMERIDAYTLATEGTEPPRKYLGASSLGEPCLRKLWLTFRWVKPEQWSPKMLRLFKSGDIEEPRMIALLRGAGFTVWASCEHPDDDPQFKFKDAGMHGHFAGTVDAIGLEPGGDEPFLIEFKTFKSETKLQPSPGFESLVKQGVKAAAPRHFFQCQVYMGQLGLKRALYCARNKNNDDIWMTWIDFDRQIFEELLTKAEIILSAETPPERISNDPTTFLCRYCHLNQICFNNTAITHENRHCRNCRHSHPAENSRWNCSLGKEFGTLCKDYSPIVGGSNP